LTLNYFLTGGQALFTETACEDDDCAESIQPICAFSGRKWILHFGNILPG